jgi:hypothetical protein
MSANLNGVDHNGNGGAHTVSLTGQVTAAKRLASTLVCSFELCQDEGEPLSDRQQIAILTAALLEFDGIAEELDSVLALEQLFTLLRSAPQ